MTEKDKIIKPKEYGFIVKFKNEVSKKEKNRIIKLMLKQKCIDKIIGAITLW